MVFISNELKEAAEQLLLRDGLGEAGHEWGQSVVQHSRDGVLETQRSPIESESPANVGFQPF
jgi:hypothetical protein